MKKLEEKSHMKKNKMKKEQWLPVEGYEGLYEVSNLGRVKSLNYNHTGKEKILKPKKHRDGYLQVQLWRDGKHKMFQVHRLVATAFIPNPEGFEQVNHRDEVKTNNCASNLEFCDCKYNNNYGTRNERAAAARINHPALSKVVEASRFSDFREIELCFASTAEAGRNGYDQRAVSKCCNECYSANRRNFYKNLYWRFAK